MPFLCWQALGTKSKKQKRCTEAQGLEIHQTKRRFLPAKSQTLRKKSTLTRSRSQYFLLLEGKSQVSGTADSINGSRNYRNTAQNPCLVARSPDTHRNWHQSLTWSGTDCVLFDSAFVSSFRRWEETKQKTERTCEQKVYKMMDEASLLVQRKRRQYKRRVWTRQQHIIRERYRQHLKPRGGGGGGRRRNHTTASRWHYMLLSPR